MRTVTLTAQCQASLLKMDLEFREVAEGGEAEKTALLAVALHDPHALRAALWLGAEALYRYQEPGALVPLRDRSQAIQTRYLSLAKQAFASIRLALEGGFPHAVLQQALADDQTHAQQGPQLVTQEVM